MMEYGYLCIMLLKYTQEDPGLHILKLLSRGLILLSKRPWGS